jgi:hypothetical protein
MKKSSASSTIPLFWCEGQNAAAGKCTCGVCKAQIFDAEVESVVATMRAKPKNACVQRNGCFVLGEPSGPHDDGVLRTSISEWGRLASVGIGC